MRSRRFLLNTDAPVFHEISPMAAASLVPMLNSRGYRPIELSSVLYLGLESASDVPVTSNPNISTRVITPGDVDLWARTSAAGWATEHEGLADLCSDWAKSAQCDGAYPYLAELDGNPIATKCCHSRRCRYARRCQHHSRRPKQRRPKRPARGPAQICRRTRLHSRRHGTAPGSQSQKNGQKNGFKIAYTRIKWQLDR